MVAERIASVAVIEAGIGAGIAKPTENARGEGNVLEETVGHPRVFTSHGAAQSAESTYQTFHTSTGGKI